MESKIKCDRQYPCSKCASRGRECIFNSSARRSSVASHPIQEQLPLPITDSSSESSTSPSTLYPTIEGTNAYNASSFHIQDTGQYSQTSNQGESSSHAQPELSTSVSMPSFSENKVFALRIPASASASDLYSSTTSEANTTNDDGRLVPAHLSSVNASEMFESFFSNIFSASLSIPIAEDYSWTYNVGLNTSSSEDFPFVSPMQPSYEDSSELTDSLTFPPTPRAALNDVPHSPITDGTCSLAMDPLAPELQHYRKSQLLVISDCPS